MFGGFFFNSTNLETKLAFATGLPDSVEMITIEDITSSSALISWLPPRPGTPEVTAYYVFYKPKNLEDTKYRKKIVRGQRYFVKLSELTSSTKYELEVVAGNSNGNTTRSETKTFKTLDTGKGASGLSLSFLET